MLPYQVCVTSETFFFQGKVCAKTFELINLSLCKKTEREREATNVYKKVYTQLQVWCAHKFFVFDNSTSYPRSVRNSLIKKLRKPAMLISDA